MANGNGNGKDLLALLLRDVENLKSSSREHSEQMESLSEQMESVSEQMESLSERMSSLSQTMAQTAQAIGLIGKTIAQQSTRSREHEGLYGRLAKTLIAFKATTDHRFDRLETRVRRLERGGVRH